MKKSIFDPSIQNIDLASKITAGFERLSNAFQTLLWDQAKVIGLSPIQIRILIFVSYHPDSLCNVSHLAKEFNVTKPTISDSIRILEKKKLIVKEASSIDRRAYTILLSPKGEKTVENVQSYAEPIKKVVAHLNVEEQEKLFGSLITLITELNISEVLNIQRTCFRCRYYQQNDIGHYCRLMQKELQEKELRIDCQEFSEI